MLNKSSFVTLYECRSVKLAGEVTGITHQTYQEARFSSIKDVIGATESSHYAESVLQIQHVTGISCSCFLSNCIQLGKIEYYQF